jgi:hypothetical protein
LPQLQYELGVDPEVVVDPIVVDELVVLVVVVVDQVVLPVVEDVVDEVSGELVDEVVIVTSPRTISPALTTAPFNVIVDRTIQLRA